MIGTVRWNTSVARISMFHPSVYLWTERMANEEHLKREGEFSYIDVGDGPPAA